MFIDTLYECYRQSEVKPFEKALENLIQENKELKEKIEEYEKQLDLDYVEGNYILKSALQELLDIDEIDIVHCRLKRLLGDDN
jgi:hypothetical protein